MHGREEHIQGKVVFCTRGVFSATRYQNTQAALGRFIQVI